MEQASEKATSRSQDSIGTADTAASSTSAFDMVAASEWPDLPADVVLLTPAQCRMLWRQFSSDSVYAVQQVGQQPAPLTASIALLQSLPPTVS